MLDEIKPTKRVVHPEFGRRMQLACDGNLRVPPPNHGRLGWIANEIQERFGKPVTIETVRKWFAGETIPRPTTMGYLAAVLEVDLAWLSVGKAPEVTEKAQKVRNAMADGAVNLIAGLIQMSGGYPAFPTENDRRAKDSKIDLYAVIKGAQYAFHVALGEANADGTIQFAIPVPSVEDAFVIGLIRTGELGFRFFELERDAVVGQGKRKGDYYALTIPSQPGPEWREITSFQNRL